MNSKKDFELHRKQVRALWEVEMEVGDKLRLTFEDHDIATRNLEGKINKEIDQIGKIKNEISK